MKKIVLLGAGGHCKSVIDVIKKMNCFDEIVITDPVIKRGTKILGCDVVGTDDCLEELYRQKFEYAFITVGSIGINQIRFKLADKASGFGFKFPVIQDPSAVVSDSAVIGDGTFIGKNAVINAEAKIGNHCIINTGAIIEHECVVGDFAHISVGTTLCGQVRVGNNCMIGSRSTVIQCLNIGENCIVGAGAVVISDLTNDNTAVGVPAKVR